MKKINFLLLLMFFSMVASAQNVVLPDETKAFYAAKRACNNAYTRYCNGTQDEKTEKFKLVEQRMKDLQRMKSFSHSNCYQAIYYDYARLLAEQGDYKKAIKYFDKAFYAKMMSAEEFSYGYVRAYFKNDTVLYQKKLSEYRKKEPMIYSYEENEIRKELYSWLQMDQLSIKLSDYWPLKSKEVEILAFKDSLLCLKIEECEKKYPDVENIFGLDRWSSIIILRHLFSAHPEIWLEKWEPRDRQRVLDGNWMPEEYAYQYDFSIIRTGQGNSYYGEYTNCGENANPDTALVDQHRADIGLPPLKEKAKDEMLHIHLVY